MKLGELAILLGKTPEGLVRAGAAEGIHGLGAESELGAEQARQPMRGLASGASGAFGASERARHPDMPVGPPLPPALEAVRREAAARAAAEGRGTAGGQVPAKKPGGCLLWIVLGLLLVAAGVALGALLKARLAEMEGIGEIIRQIHSPAGRGAAVGGAIGALSGGAAAFFFGWGLCIGLLKRRRLGGSTRAVVVRSYLDRVYSKSQWLYYLVLDLQYEVGGQMYSLRHEGRAKHNLMAVHERALQRHAPGAVMPIYYDPKNPEKWAMKQPGWGRWLGVLLFGALGVFGFALFMFAGAIFF